MSIIKLLQTRGTSLNHRYINAKLSFENLLRNFLYLSFCLVKIPCHKFEHS